ncbi:Leucine-rich repeat-containing protein [Cynara cardunculus var. scolymus]|uniref:Leucine-rich repeat-containing protein n=1 Tax=Cynara cardunculus var. scolymus TaxID=59895 RepID=A0A103XP58_CYNCS|nr:Leucine-rich repeat-containing protein [Cynara cardunculus var. scolymus]
MGEQFLMKLCRAQLLRVWPFFVILSLLPLACADLDSDRQALLSFAADVPHGPRLDWSNATDICTSWVGITCNSDATRVLTVRLPASGLNGPIPPNTLGELDALRVLSLRSNRLYGNLPSDLLSLPSLRSLFLQHNNFTSNIPAFFPRRLHILDLSFNSFTGNIPATIQYLTSLTGFYLQNNSISGPIPNVTFSKLKHINMSYNNLNGSIPSSFKTFPYSSFTGNPFLCGPPLKSCPLHPPSRPSPKRKFPFWAIIAIAVGGVVAGLLLVALFVFCFLKNKSSDESRVRRGKSPTDGRGENPRAEFGSGVVESENNRLVFFEGCSFNFDLDDLLRASAEVLGKGSFGTAYKAVLELEESMTVVVKRMKEVAVGRNDFEQQMEIIGRVGQHPNVVPLRAYYYSKDEKLLVYDYFQGGSLMSLLHGNNGVGRMPLDWENRVKIVLGTARGIAHIHSIGGPRFSHGNIKASNVLINQDMDGCISDIGLPPLMNTPSSSHTAGYRAPEVVETRKHSHKSDVYSFGVLLLEMLTGKQPIQSPGREDMVVDLPRWVQSVVREEWSAEVFDVELMRFHDIEEEMVQFLQIGLACVVRVPDNRPTIHEVVRMIEQTRLYDFENGAPSD